MYETGNQDRDIRRELENYTASINRLADLVESLDASLKRLEDTAMGTFVQISRLYDITAAVGAGTNSTGLVELINMHEDGFIYTSPPTLKGFGEEDKEEE